MKSLNRLFVLIGLMFLVGCSSAPKVNTDVPVKKANPPAKQVQATPKKQIPIAVKKSTVPEQPKDEPVLQPKPKPQPKPVVSAPAPVEEVAPPPPKNESPKLTFRCAFWERPETLVPLFLNINGTFRQLPLYELAFGKTFSLPRDNVVLFTKKGDVYTPCFLIDTHGLTDCAVLVFPEKDVVKRKEHPYSHAHLFDFSETTAPYGSLLIYNWSGLENPLKCLLNFRNGTTEEFLLKSGEFGVTSGITDRRQLCDFKIIEIISEKEERVLVSSSLALRDDSCFYLYLVPQDKGSDTPINFKSFKRHKN